MAVNTNSRVSILARIALLASLIALAQGPAEAAESRGMVGTAVKGVNAVEYIGVIQQVGPQFSAIGYLTYVHGLDPADLFTDPVVHDASTARFTFSSSAGIVSRAQVGTVTQLGGIGNMTIYFNELGGADFNDSASFSSGLEIAAFDARYQNILAVIAPNQGVASGTADAVQRTAHSFVLNGNRLMFGHPQLPQHLTIFGGATRSQADPPVSTTHFAAYGVTQ